MRSRAVIRPRARRWASLSRPPGRIFFFTQFDQVLDLGFHCVHLQVKLYNLPAKKQIIPVPNRENAPCPRKMAIPGDRCRKKPVRAPAGASMLKTARKYGKNRAMKHILFTVNPVNTNGDFVYLIQHASLVVKLVLLLLLSFSIISWAIIIFKLMEYSRARKNSLKFLDFFKKNKNFSEINSGQGALRQQPPGGDLPLRLPRDLPADRQRPEAGKASTRTACTGRCCAPPTRRSPASSA